MKQLRLLPAVLHDTAQAAEWYDKEGYVGLGDKFLDACYAHLAHLQDHGEIYRPVYEDFRRISSGHFPTLFTIDTTGTGSSFHLLSTLHAVRGVRNDSCATVEYPKLES